MCDDGPDLPDLFDVGCEHIAPHVQLWTAVLRRAVVEYVLYANAADQRKRRLGASAKAWLFDHDNAQEFNSVRSVCMYLNMDYDVFIGKLLLVDEETVRSFRGMGLD